jgi:hypothetical protein
MSVSGSARLPTPCSRSHVDGQGSQYEYEAIIPARDLRLEICRITKM